MHDPEYSAHVQKCLSKLKTKEKIKRKRLTKISYVFSSIQCGNYIALAV